MPTYVLPEGIQLLYLAADGLLLTPDGFPEEAVQLVTSPLQPVLSGVHLPPVPLVFVHQSIQQGSMVQAVCLQLLVAGIQV